MNDYVSPVVFDNEELAEGVYASGSGNADCWVMTFRQRQRVDYNDGDNFVIYEIEADHLTDVLHLSMGTIMTVTYNAPDITSIRVENVYCNLGKVEDGISYDQKNGFKVSCEANGATIKREYLADGYKSGDHFVIEIRINSPKGDAVMTGLSWQCMKMENVQDTAGPAGEGNPSLTPYTPQGG